MSKYINLQLTPDELDRIDRSTIPLKLIAHRAINDWCELSTDRQVELTRDRKHHRIDNPTTAKIILADAIVEEWIDSHGITNNSETLSTAIAYHLDTHSVLNPPLVIPANLADKLYAKYPEPQAIFDAIEMLLLF